LSSAQLKQGKTRVET